MSDLYRLTNKQMARLQPYFPKSHGKQRDDDKRVLSGIVFVNRNGLRWCDTTDGKRWGEKGIFLRMTEGWPPQAPSRRPS